ncbi:metallophosphoesterase family protein [Thiocapsa bogorovii]|uniref:metallophosphoesterase family protein n=1 Tax=Thiocapsa bogorovii TaxID=521689 RepID=UPI001E36C21C|nr:metallophosphoesterase [Thiocapsa bogorovii]UHD17839.1 metallophosphoesterase [Thiocapsa bogorovii]
MVRILHVSDVHFGISDNAAEQERMLKGISKYFDTNSINLDFLIFSGDLSQRANETELMEGFDWLSRLAAVTCSQILVVPGNHDVDRASAEIDDLRLASPTEDSFNRQKGKIYRSHNHLRPFFDCFEQIQNDNFLNGWRENPFIDCVSVEKQGLPIHFLCLNTAVLSCGNDDERRLCVDMNSINGCLKDFDAETNLIIAVGHHPLDWLADWNAQKLSSTLNQETGPHVYLHGHLHERSGKSAFAATGAGIASFAAGAAYQGAEWEQSFWIIDVDLAKSRLVCQLVEYANDSGTWEKNAKLSKSIPVRLPSVADQGGRIEEVPIERVHVAVQYENPFDSVAANDINPHIIPKLFVDKNNFLNRITNKFDAIVEGQRGTGKTMLLRYLSIDAQHAALESRKADERLRQLEYFGIYCRISTKGFARTDVQVIGDRDRRAALFGERLTLFFVARAVDSLSVLIDENTRIENGLGQFGEN